MTKREISKLFEDRKIRTVWDDKEEKWYFSIVDVVSVLTDQPDIEHARNYWKVLKHRLKKEGNESVTNCNQLKLRSSDGKSYKTDVADTEQLFRIIQSIPSPKAEPIKQWIAHVAAERIDQMQDPELSIHNTGYHSCIKGNGAKDSACSSGMKSRQANERGHWHGGKDDTPTAGVHPCRQI